MTDNNDRPVIPASLLRKPGSRKQIKDLGVDPANLLKMIARKEVKIDYDN